jgi:HK97 family phage major capsid protein
VFNAKKIGVRTVVSTEMTEDSIVPVLPYVRDKIALALAEAQENILINGDLRTSGTTNLSGLTYASGGQLQAWDGYRRMAQISGTTTDLSGTFSLANLRKLRTAMGKYGVSTKNLAFVVGINAYHTLLDIEQVVTVDKIGSRATILDGQMGSIDGIPILISEFVSEDLDAVGEGTGGGTTEILCVRTDAMRFGDRRGITLKSREQIETDQNVVVALQRLDFKAVQSTADPIVSAGVGVALKA